MPTPSHAARVPGQPGGRRQVPTSNRAFALVTASSLAARRSPPRRRGDRRRPRVPPERDRGVDQAQPTACRRSPSRGRWCARPAQQRPNSRLASIHGRISITKVPDVSRLARRVAADYESGSDSNLLRAAPPIISTSWTKCDELRNAEFRPLRRVRLTVICSWDLQPATFLERFPQAMTEMWLRPLDYLQATHEACRRWTCRQRLFVQLCGTGFAPNGIIGRANSHRYGFLTQP